MPSAKTRAKMLERDQARSEMTIRPCKYCGKQVPVNRNTNTCNVCFNTAVFKLVCILSVRGYQKRRDGSYAWLPTNSNEQETSGPEQPCLDQPSAESPAIDIPGPVE